MCINHTQQQFFCFATFYSYKPLSLLHSHVLSIKVRSTKCFQIYMSTLIGPCTATYVIIQLASHVATAQWLGNADTGQDVFSGWTTRAEDDVGFYSCQTRTQIWVFEECMLIETRWFLIEQKPGKLLFFVNICWWWLCCCCCWDPPNFMWITLYFGALWWFSITNSSVLSLDISWTSNALQLFGSWIILCTWHWHLFL